MVAVRRLARLAVVAVDGLAKNIGEYIGRMTLGFLHLIFPEQKHNGLSGLACLSQLAA
jgi:hypothetical protein